MKFIDIEKLDRKIAYERFKAFDNATYGCSVEMDVTNLVKFSKKKWSVIFS